MGETLQIIDRVKNVFKIMTSLKGRVDIFAEQVHLSDIWPWGPSFSHIVAVVVPNKAEVIAELGIASYEEMDSTEKLRKLLRDEMEKFGKLNNLEPWELVEGKFHIELTPWTEKDLIPSNR